MNQLEESKEAKELLEFRMLELEVTHKDAEEQLKKREERLDQEVSSKLTGLLKDWGLSHLLKDIHHGNGRSNPGDEDDDHLGGHINVSTLFLFTANSCRILRDIIWWWKLAKKGRWSSSKWWWWWCWCWWLFLLHPKVRDVVIFVNQGRIIEWNVLSCWLRRCMYSWKIVIILTCLEAVSAQRQFRFWKTKVITEERMYGSKRERSVLRRESFWSSFQDLRHYMIFLMLHLIRIYFSSFNQKERVNEMIIRHEEKRIKDDQEQDELGDTYSQDTEGSGHGRWRGKVQSL